MPRLRESSTMSMRSRVSNWTPASRENVAIALLCSADARSVFQIGAVIPNPEPAFASTSSAVYRPPASERPTTAMMVVGVCFTLSMTAERPPREDEPLAQKPLEGRLESARNRCGNARGNMAAMRLTHQRPCCGFELPRRVALAEQTFEFDTHIKGKPDWLSVSAKIQRRVYSRCDSRFSASHSSVLRYLASKYVGLVLTELRM